MIETARKVMIFIGIVMAKMLMEVIKVIIWLIIIGLILFAVVLIKAIREGLFTDEEDDDIDWDSDDDSEDDDR